MTKNENEERIELKQMIDQLRRDLTEAAEGRKNQALKFRVDSIELELQVGVERTRSAKVSGSAKLKFWVWPIQAGLGAEVESERARTRTQTIKIKLTPRTEDDKDFLTSRRG